MNQSANSAAGTAPVENPHIISSGATIRMALDSLCRLSDGVMTLIVIDSEEKVCGTLTDGDIRRALLRGASVDAPVSQAMFTAFTSLSDTADVKQIRNARRRGIRLLPVTDAAGHLVRTLDLSRGDSLLPLSAILMAGGKGERLRPLTLDTPKPLLEIDGMAIIDYNVRNLARAGITDITATTRYLAPMIEEHFSRERFGVKVKCVREDRPLGTIGAASLVERTSGGDTLVMNSDLLTTLSLEEMFLFHKAEKADVTIAAIPYTVSVPYAILATDGRRVTALEEKPTYSHYANAGIYIFSNELLDTVSPDVATDAPDLIERAIASGRKVVFFPIDGTWIDIGTPADFRHAQELMRHHRAMERF